MLTQEGRVIEFASRALTTTETHYSQTEREALAIVWACEHFHIYLFGAPFSVHTDHKPLVALFNNPRAQLSTRIERWVLRLQPYDLTIRYRPGADNPADYLSRHPVAQEPSSRSTTIAEEYVNYVVATSTPKAMTCEEVAEATAHDPTLSAVIDAISTNQWHRRRASTDEKAFHTLFLCRSELSLAYNGRIILKGRQIVLPASLQQKAVNIAHSGHQGIVKTIALMREKVWFCNMQAAVDFAVKNCMTCQVATRTPAREPLQMSELPNAPWTEVSCDFGHLDNGQYLLVITDEYSRYPIVDIVDSTSANSVIPKLDKVFAEFGIPQTLKTDNGPPFNSKDFAAYCTHLGFRHRKITPEWPRANGETERFMQTVKKTIKGSAKPNFRQDLYRFLLDYRTTPHCTTGVPPATALFHRTLKTWLPELPPQRLDDDSPMRDRDTKQKARMKQYADNKAYVRPSPLSVGDPVLLKNSHATKADTPFQPTPLVIIAKKGSMVTAQRGTQRVTRNSSFFKLAPRHPTQAETDVEQIEHEDSTQPMAPDTVQPTDTQNAFSQNFAPLILRRSTREVRKPRHLDDFVLE